MDGALSRFDAAEWVRSYGVRILQAEDAGAYTHIFTHVEWHMRGFRFRTDRPLPAYTYVTPEELDAGYALPSAFKYFRAQMG